MTRLLMGIGKNRHGTYYAIKQVPKHLQEVVARVLNNGKARQTWLKRSLATKDAAQANRIAKPVLIEFDRIGQSERFDCGTSSACRSIVGRNQAHGGVPLREQVGFAGRIHT